MKMDLINALNWRYAVKRMNGEQVPDEKVERILDAIRLSASSMGLQPYTIVTVTNEEVKKALQPASYQQPQVIEGSHVIVFAAWTDISEKQVDEYMQQIAEVRGVSLDSLKEFRTSLISSVQGKSPDERFEWAARQAYIALGTAMTAAALEKVDATPMEGFIPDEVDQILNLKEKGLRSTAMLVLGFRDEQNDFLANAKKVRRDKEKLILHLN
jgi:nitroreductase / dihydropteridine reductase